jgi:hypothetical protein
MNAGAQRLPFGAELHAYCQSLPGTAAAARHFDRTAYRVNGRVYATIGPDGDINLMGTPEEAQALAASVPFVSVEGNWWKLGAFHCEPLTPADLETTCLLIDGVHAAKAAMKPARSRKRST